MVTGVSSAAKFTFHYYSARSNYWSYDGLPFGGVYVIAVAALAAHISHRSGSLESLVWLLLPATLHVLLFLATHWSVEVRCLVRFKPETSLEKASHVKVVPLPRPGSQRRKVLLVPIQRKGDELSLSYLKKKYIFNKDTQLFERLRYDISSPLEKYLEASGLSSAEVAAATERFGSNAYDIPLPTFSELFQEHAVAPFFVFQVFCVLLWLMDEYWYYSLLTLFMLIVLEAQMVHRRIGDMAELRSMRIPPRPMYSFRDGNWQTVQSDELLPGDIVGIARKADASFPCDALLLHGSVLANEAMLTGESVPQNKVALSPMPDSPEMKEALDLKGRHRQHIVSAGTNIMLHQSSGKAKNFKKAPLVGTSPVAIGYVLRTGFDTTQGKLCRTILFSAERVTVSSREALYFLMILLAFAIGACVYVLYDGLVVGPTQRPDEPARSTFKLFLAVSHIITSVVPPEFPIMLSLAVNLSLVALVHRRIFCTEPFRVPLAGRVETCCFDKTGTLTSDSMEVSGVYGLASSPAPPKENEPEEDSRGPDGALGHQLPFLSTAVMAACSGLTLVEAEVVGDPLEKAALQAIQWFMVGPDLLASRAGRAGDRLQILRRYPFVSELQRMTVVVRHVGPGLGHLQEPSSPASVGMDRKLVLVKGSFEMLRPRLKKPPEQLDSLQEQLTKSGLRVLCLAGRELKPSEVLSDLERLDREALEQQLEFGGLLVLRNAVKPQTSSTIRQLRRSYHRVVMITGDHPLTACQVAVQVSMSTGHCLILEPARQSDNPSALEWRSREDPTQPALPFNAHGLRELAKSHTLCVPGWSLAKLAHGEMESVALAANIFARVSPQQKEEVVTAINSHSHTMMVGDGTNDVGALKHAHVGVSLLSGSTSSTRVVGGRAVPGSTSSPDVDGAVPLVRLGDASIASPFTYKGDSIKCGLHILRCGRATLATVLMMYKIMGINSMMSAFAMSVLTLDGVKLGDTQTTLESVFTSMCFFLLSRSAPAKQLARQQPTSSVFAWHVMLSLALQLVIHLTVLLRGWQMAKGFRAEGFKRDLEGEFEPNLTNTVVFQLIAAMHASSFLANYEGKPFMQPLSSNKALLYSLGFFVFVIFLTASELVPSINSGLSLVLSPTPEFRREICLLLAADIGLTALVSRSLNSLAVHLKGQAAERRAKAMGLVLADGEAADEDAEEPGSNSADRPKSKSAKKVK